jgi:hypothetical protein
VGGTTEVLERIQGESFWHTGIFWHGGNDSDGDFSAVAANLVEENYGKRDVYKGRVCRECALPDELDLQTGGIQGAWALTV